MWHKKKKLPKRWCKKNFLRRRFLEIVWSFGVMLRQDQSSIQFSVDFTLSTQPDDLWAPRFPFWLAGPGWALEHVPLQVSFPQPQVVFSNERAAHVPPLELSALCISVPTKTLSCKLQLPWPFQTTISISSTQGDVWAPPGFPKFPPSSQRGKW